MTLRDVKFPFTYSHLKENFILENTTNINKIKNISLILVPSSIFLLDFFYTVTSQEKGFQNYSYATLSSANFYYDEFNPITFLIYCFIAYLVTFFLSMWLHQIAHFKVRTVSGYRNLNPFTLIKKYFYFLKEENSFKPWIIALVSPDLSFSYYYKKCIKKAVSLEEFFVDTDTFSDKKENLSTYQWNSLRIKNKFFIEFSNWLNIILTLILFFTLYLLHNVNSELILFIIMYRIISRGVEITVAFYKDVVQINSKQFILKDKEIYINGFKSSLIRKPGRLSLAIHSLIEMIFLFALAYYVFFQVITSLNNNFVSFTGENLSTPSLFETLLISATLGLFNISFGAFPNILLALLHTSQILLSGILILLSLAQYIGDDNSLNTCDEKFYNEMANLNFLLHSYKLEKSNMTKYYAPSQYINIIFQNYIEKKKPNSYLLFKKIYS